MTRTTCSRSPTERPILFTAVNYAAIVAGVKTQTRRVAKGDADACPYGAPGDRLWVKRTRFMSRRASPLTLEILAVRRERLHDISERDVRAEGCMARAMFAALWDTLNKARGHGWWTNPLVWVIDFRTYDA